MARVWCDVGRGASPCRRLPEPMPDPSHDVTRILAELTAGDDAAADRLLPLLYDELRDIAARAFRNERANHTLQPTVLVHEAYLRLMQGAQVDWNDRVHFLSVMATAMRRLLIDHARRRQAERRGGDAVRVTLDDIVAAEHPGLDLIALEEALEQLTERDERLARIVELRFFGGLTIAETAQVLDVGTTTVEDGWARAWLSARLQGGGSR